MVAIVWLEIADWRRKCTWRNSISENRYPTTHLILTDFKWTSFSVEPQQHGTSSFFCDILTTYMCPESNLSSEARNHASYMRHALKTYQWIKNARFRLVFPHPRSPSCSTHMGSECMGFPLVSFVGKSSNTTALALARIPYTPNYMRATFRYHLRWKKQPSNHYTFLVKNCGREVTRTLPNVKGACMVWRGGFSGRGKSTNYCELEESGRMNWTNLR